jgi:D-3-phosphoglycerate dehydrogenase / 2-oxoglutarate reductase
LILFLTRILVSDSISKEALDKLDSIDVTFDYNPEISKEELVKIIAEYDALIVRGRTKVTREVIEKGTKLKVIGRAGVGVDNIDSKAAAERGVKVVNTPDALTNAVAEFTVGLMIDLSRRISYADSNLRDGKWLKNEIMGHELKGKIYGTIGIGRIGSRVAELVHGFGMQIMANDVIPIPKELVSRLGIRVSTQDEVFTLADFVDLHVPLLPETTNLVNYAKLSKMKRSAYLINTSRGKVVNEADLERALGEKIIAGAALDVFEKEPLEKSPLLNNERVIITPHIGGQTEEAQSQAGTAIVEMVMQALA